MDYVVYGTGYGATLMLLGYAIRTWGPGLRFRDGEEAAYDRREFLSAQSSWRRFTAGLGAAVATAGAALVLVTLLMMLATLSDGLGSTIALAVSGLLLLGVAVWAWMFFSRFGTWGVVAMPGALTSYEPRTYDSRAAQTSAVAATGEPAEADVTDGDASVDDEDEIALADDEDVDAAELDDESDETDEAWFDAQYSKFKSHHPVEDDAIENADDAGDDDKPVEEIEEYVEALTPEEVTEDIVDDADEEPAGAPDEPIETYEELVGETREARESGGDVADGSVTDNVVQAEADAGSDAIEKDPLEVLPEAHEAIGLLVEPEPEREPDPESQAREDAGGREDALRRLRERQAERARQRAADDA